MPRKFTQQLLPFAESNPAARAEAVAYRPSEEAVQAIDELRDWLTDPRTRRPATRLGEDALGALKKALVEGKNGWWHAAEAALETLRLRNGKAEGDDIPAGLSTSGGRDFHQVLEDCLDCLEEQRAARGPGR